MRSPVHLLLLIAAPVAAQEMTITLRSQEGPPTVDLARSHLAAGNWAAAEAVACHVVAEEPGRASAHNVLGRALRLEGFLVSAEAEFRRATELDPGNAWYHNNLGLTLSDRLRFNEALAPLERAVECDPENGAAWSNLAFARWQARTGDPLEAIGRAAALNPAWGPNETMRDMIENTWSPDDEPVDWTAWASQEAAAH